MEELIQYIYDKGHRKIAYIHGQKFSYVTRERLASFYQMMDRLGIEVPEDYVKEAEYLETEGTAKYTRELLSMEEVPTCILYPDDTSLIGGWNVILEAGLRIPEDISIAGYDGSKVSQLLHPKLTTIRQETEEIGKQAAIHLIRKIEKPKTTLVTRVVIDGKLLNGQSVGSIPVI